MLTTNEAASTLGITLRMVQAHITSGQIKAQKIGRDWLISDEEMERFQRERRKVGRPKREKDDETV